MDVLKKKSVNKLHPAVVSEVEEAVCDVFQEHSVILCRYNFSRIHRDVETSGEEIHTHTHTHTHKSVFFITIFVNNIFVLLLVLFDVALSVIVKHCQIWKKYDLIVTTIIVVLGVMAHSPLKFVVTD